jgi:hypothetical protein
LRAVQKMKRWFDKALVIRRINKYEVKGPAHGSQKT